MSVGYPFARGYGDHIREAIRELLTNTPAVRHPQGKGKRRPTSSREGRTCTRLGCPRRQGLEKE